MAYSIDLRRLVVCFVKQGGSKAEASRRFNVSLWCVNDRCNRTDLSPKQQGPRFRKIDNEALLAHIHTHPDALLRERAAVFGVREAAIWYRLKQLKITYKKNDALH